MSHDFLYEQMLRMSKDSDPNVGAESGSDTDSDWLNEEGPLKLRNQERKRKVTRRSSGRSSNEDRRVSFSPHVLPQKRLPNSPSVLQKLEKSLKQEPKLFVTCGNKEGVLHKDKFSKGEPCILAADQWFTPPQFERFGGKEKNKNWKYSVCCTGVQLKVLIWEGFLSSPSNFKRKHSRDKEPQSRKKMIRSRRSIRQDCHTINSVSTSPLYKSEGSTDEKEEEDDDDEGDGDDVRFKVTCSTGKGVLHVQRFATETHGKCIRTQDAWLTPKDFLNQNTTNGNWRRDIRKDNGEPLGELLMRRVLKRHILNCSCYICTGDLPHLLDQNNDDWCFKCKVEGDLVCCRTCPRAFHHNCHKPALRDDDSDHWTCSFCKKSRKKKPS